MSKITSAMAVLGVVAGLGVTVLPLSSYAAESTPITIRTTVNSSIAVSTDAPQNIVDLGSVAGDNTVTGTTNVTVSGTLASYKLYINDVDNDLNMKLVDETGFTNTGLTEDAIPALTTAGPTLSGNWGYRVRETGVAAGDWKGIVAYGTTDTTSQINTGTLNGTDAVTTVEFGVNAKITDLKNGVYEDQVIFTALDGA